jgi:hypothetical protein
MFTEPIGFSASMSHNLACAADFLQLVAAPFGLMETQAASVRLGWMQILPSGDAQLAALWLLTAAPLPRQLLLAVLGEPSMYLILDGVRSEK